MTTTDMGSSHIFAKTAGATVGTHVTAVLCAGMQGSGTDTPALEAPPLPDIPASQYPDYKPISPK